VLYLVATPIGNLGDITLRALEVLKSADLIAAEDTRHSLRLLQHYAIHKPLVSYHEHNEARRTAELLVHLREGKIIALITDAGMPGVSDPGWRLLKACREEGLEYTVLPGPSAVLTALIGSGISSERFLFAGFLPVKSGQREREVRGALERTETTVFFESPHRILKTLECFATLAPEHRLCVARELTKQFEEFRTATAAELLAHYTAHPAKGEICLVIEGRSAKSKIVRNEEA